MNADLITIKKWEDERKDALVHRLDFILQTSGFQRIDVNQAAEEAVQASFPNYQGVYERNGVFLFVFSDTNFADKGKALINLLWFGFENAIRPIIDDLSLKYTIEKYYITWVCASNSVEVLNYTFEEKYKLLNVHTFVDFIGTV